MRTIIKATALMLCLVLPGAVAAEETVLRQISVSGQGSVVLPPDMATVTLGVQVEAKTEAGAMDEASIRMGIVLEEFAAREIAQTDIRTTGVRLTPRYHRTQNSGIDFTKVDGYSSTATITVKIRDINSVGAVLAAVVGDGANMVQGINFGLQDDAGARDRARRRAVAEAIRLAALYVDAADAKLGPVLRMSDGSGGDQYRPNIEMMAMDSVVRSSAQVPVPVAPGEITVRSSINMTFQIID